MGLEFDIDKLLKPYEEGGTANSPVKRTMSTIVSALVNRDGFSPDVVGVAILRVFNNMLVEGLEFEGNGSYGSKGAELFSCIKAQCIEMRNGDALDRVKVAISKLASCVRVDCPKRTVEVTLPPRKKRIVLVFLNLGRFWRLIWR